MSAATKCAIVCGAGYVSGKEIMALQLARGLLARGWEADFVISSWNDGDFSARLHAEGIPFRKLPIGFIAASLSWRYLRMTLEQAWRTPGLLLGYSRFLATFRPARVVHTNWHHLLLLLPFLRPSRDFLWAHEIFPSTPQYRRLFQIFESRVYSFVCVSQAVSRSLLAIGVAPERVRVVRNGIADPLGSQATETGERRGSSAFLRVGIVGQVGEWKGHDDLVEAIAILNRKGVPVKLEIFGRGDESYVSALRTRIREHGLNDLVGWRGFVANRSEIYDDLDVCVVPSRFEEPFGLTALEPAFFSLPVIATRRGGLPEIVRDQETGLLVEARSPDQIAAALLQLSADRDFRFSLGRSARKLAVQEFGEARFLDEFTNQLLESSPGSELR